MPFLLTLPRWVLLPLALAAAALFWRTTAPRPRTPECHQRR